jgi:hypothetical protein
MAVPIMVVPFVVVPFVVVPFVVVPIVVVPFMVVPFVIGLQNPLMTLTIVAFKSFRIKPAFISFLNICFNSCLFNYGESSVAMAALSSVVVILLYSCSCVQNLSLNQVNN